MLTPKHILRETNRHQLLLWEHELRITQGPEAQHLHELVVERLRNLYKPAPKRKSIFQKLMDILTLF